MTEVCIGTVLDPVIFGKLMAGGWLDNEKAKVAGMQILRKNKFTCSSCGFVSRSSVQVPHGYMIPVDYAHPGLLAAHGDGDCLCSICAASIGINWSVTIEGQGDSSAGVPGMLIAQSRLTQVQINRLALQVISLLASQPTPQLSKLQSAARDIDAAMTALNHELGGSIPFYRGNDSDFARALSLIPQEYYEQREDILGSLRFWPNVRYWKEQGVYWMKSTFEDMLASDNELLGVVK